MFLQVLGVFSKPHWVSWPANMSGQRDGHPFVIFAEDDEDDMVYLASISYLKGNEDSVPPHRQIINKVGIEGCDILLGGAVTADWRVNWSSGQCNIGQKLKTQVNKNIQSDTARRQCRELNPRDFSEVMGRGDVVRLEREIVSVVRDHVFGQESESPLEVELFEISASEARELRDIKIRGAKRILQKHSSGHKYRRYPGRNAYTHHGAVNLENDAIAKRRAFVTPEEAMAICASDPHCRGFTYDPRNGWYWKLKWVDISRASRSRRYTVYVKE